MMPLRITTRILILVTLGLLVFSLLGGAGTPNEGGRPVRPERQFAPGSVRLDSATAAYSRAVNSFGFELMRQVTGRQTGGNTIVCPAGAAIVLAMVYNGAEGETKTAMAEALRLNGLTVENVNRANKALGGLLRDPGSSVALRLANSLWLKHGFTFRQDFLNRNVEFYRAEIQTLDFESASAVETINAWCAKATNDRIKRVFQSLDPEAVMILINALYFKGDWTEPFEESATAERDFSLANDSAIRHLLMQRRDMFQYFENGEVQAIRLPYGNGRLEMQVYLPSAELKMTGFLAQLDEAHWLQWQDFFQKREGTVLLPRFTLEYESDLSEPLKEMGMGIAFDRIRADFSGMAEMTSPDSVVFIKQVKQKTFLEVNEQGTEAAAVTAVTMALATEAAPMPEEPFYMEVNRPFFLSIVDRATGLRLFDAVVLDPRG